MTKSKTIIAFFLFLAVFLFIGESNTFFLENFQDSYVQVGYYLETGDSENEMRSEILKKSKEYNAQVFTISKEDGGAFSRKIIVYGNEAVQKNLKEDWGIEEGTISSFFSGKTTFIFKPFEEAGEKELQNCWYIGQSSEELYTMLFPGMVQYSGNFRNDPIQGVSEKVVAATWFVLIITILLLTYYDTVYSKKEQMVRMVLGADLIHMITHKIISDIVGFLIAALAAIILLLPFTNPLFRWNISLIGFLILLFCNGLVIVLGMGIGKHLQIKSITSSKKALNISIVIKGIISILTVLALSTTIYLSVEGIKLYKQKSYYSAKSNKVHIDIKYPYDYEKMEHATGYFEDKHPLDTWEQIKDNFMRYSYNELECSLVSYQSFEKVSPKWGDKYVFANLSGLTQYSDEISEWDVFSQKEGNYILIPDNVNQSEIIKEIMETGNLLGLDEENLEGIFTYKEGLSVIAEGHLDGEFDYTYKVKDPIVFLDTYDYGALPTYPVSYELREADHPDGMIAHNFSYLMQFVTLENNQELIYDFGNQISGKAINPSLVEFTIINIGDWFKGLWSLQNRSMLIALILTLLILILEMQISSLSLRIAYETNAKELTIKKVMGYSIFERFKTFFLLTGVLCGISLAGALLCTIIFKIGAIGYIAWGSIIVFLLDIGILLYLTRKNDNLQIQRVLKGGI